VGGVTDYQKTTDTAATIFGMSLPGESTGWLVGSDDTLLTTRDGGATFTASASGLPASCVGCNQRCVPAASLHGVARPQTAWVR
jgi:hypothetical protein